MRGRWNAITIIRIRKYNVSVVLVQPQSKSWARRSCTKTKQSFYSQQVTLPTRCSQRYVLSHVYVNIIHNLWTRCQGGALRSRLDCSAVLTASSGACGGQNGSEGYCRVSSHETNNVFSQSLTKAVYNVATACSVHKECGNFSTEQHCQVRIDSPLVHERAKFLARSRSSTLFVGSYWRLCRKVSQVCFFAALRDTKGRSNCGLC